MSSKVLTIVFTDIKGFTERTSGSDREFAVRLRAKHDELLKPIVSKYEGKLVKTIGDAFLLTFESPTNAVLCALIMQETLRKFNLSAKKEEKIEIRVAINTGEVSVQEGDILGEPVNVASRVEGITEANEIWFTEATYLAMNKQEVPTSLVGEFRLKGVPEAMKVYRVVQDPGSTAFQQVLKVQSQKMVEIDSRPAKPASRRVAIILLIAFLHIVGFSIYFTYLKFRYGELIKSTESALSEGRLLEAEQNLLTLSRRHSSEPEVRDFVGRLVLSKVRALCEKKEIDPAKTALDTMYLLFPFIQPHYQAEAAIAIAKIYQLYDQGEKDAAMAAADQFAEAGKTQVDSILEVFRFYDKTGIHWRRPFQLLAQAEALKPGVVASEPTLGENIDYYLEKVAPEDGVEEFWPIVAAHYGKSAQKKLEEALYDSNPEKRLLRWNARFYLPRLSSGTFHPFRFFASDLATPDPDVYSKSFTETMNYFHSKQLKEEEAQRKLQVKEDRAWVASLTPLIERAQADVEKKAGDWARMKQDVASYSLFLESCRIALDVLKSVP